MKIAIISSKKDAASTNIKDNLLSDFEEDKFFNNEKVYVYKNNSDIKLYTINSELINYEKADEKINADFFIFISKHKSKSEIPTLSVHSIGNWNTNELGGEPRKLVYSSSFMLRKTFLILNELGKNSGYEVVYEATHHGPYLDKPSFFIEIGSTIKEWQDKKAGKIISDTLLRIIETKNEEAKVAVGLGGLHVCPEFNKIVLRNNIALSHICPKYMLPEIDIDMLKEAISKTVEKVDLFVLDWKGLGKEKNKILAFLKDLNMEYEKTTSL